MGKNIESIQRNPDLMQKRRNSLILTWFLTAMFHEVKGHSDSGNPKESALTTSSQPESHLELVETSVGSMQKGRSKPDTT